MSSWMWDHTVEAHGGQVSENHRDDYKFRIVGVFRDSLSRQIDEALRIESVEKRGKRIGDKTAEKVVPEQKRGALPAKISETKLPYQLGWHQPSIDWGGFVSLDCSPTEQQKQVTNKQIREGVGCYESFENLCYSYVSELI